MTPVTRAIEDHETLAVAKRIMHEHGIHHLPVLQAGKLVGVLSARDVHFFERAAGPRDALTDAMSTDVYVARPDDSLIEAVRAMTDHGYTTVAVVEGERVVGLFTGAEALEWLADDIA